MPKDPNYQGQQRRALAGVATVLASASAPAVSNAAATPGGTAAAVGVASCDTCGLTLPRKADHIDVLSHPCFRLFTITLTAAGQLSLA